MRIDSALSESGTSAYSGGMYTWKSAHTGGGTEWYNYPSALARDHLTYVIGIGKAVRTPRGFIHRHADEDGYLFHYVRRGEMWIRRKGETHRVARGGVWLLDMSERFEYGNNSPTRMETWWFVCSGKDLPALFAELRAERDPIFADLDTARIESLFEQLLALTRRQPPGYEVKSSALITAILGELFESRARAGEMVTLVGRAGVHSLPVRRGIDYITRFYWDSLQLKRIADRVEMSMYYFARLFRKETGLSPMDYLNRYRIEQAKRLLKSSDKPIAQIGVMVGITDATRFARLFRRYADTTPLRFRARARKVSGHNAQKH